MRALILILVLVTTNLAAAEVYRWVDDSGVTHFSDRPREGAERITINPAQTYSAPEARVSRSERDEPKEEKEETTAYTSVAISSPQAGQAMTNTGGLVQVAIQTQPPINVNHTARVYLDGRVAEELAGGRSSTQLKEVSRGEHNLRVDIQDSTGRTLGQSDTVKFSVIQPSVLNRNNPNAPVRPTPLPPRPTPLPAR